MLEAFERHLKTIDINSKFENAKTNDDRIAIAKSFLEDNGYYVGKPKAKVESMNNHDPYPWVDPNSISHSLGKLPVSTHYTRINQDIASTNYVMDDQLKLDLLRNSHVGIHRHVMERMRMPLAEEILISGKCSFEEYRNPGDMSTTYKVKVGIFLP